MLAPIGGAGKEGLDASMAIVREQPKLEGTKPDQTGVNSRGLTDYPRQKNPTSRLPSEGSMR